MENKQNFPGAVGPSYTLLAPRFDCQETMNAYIELDEIQTGKGQQTGVLYKTPGNNFLQTIGAGPIRCLYTQSNQEVSYIVSGNELYELSGPNAIPVRLTGNLLTSSGPVQMEDNGIQIMFVDGQYGYTSVIGSGSFQQITSPNFHASECITYQDGYFILVQKGTQGFFISDINDITFPPLNETFVQGSPDVLIFAKSLNRQVYMGGAKSTEMWWNQGASASTPFVRQDGKFSQQGCAAANTVAVLNETFAWLGINSQGGGIVWMLDNNAPSRVSTFAVENSIQGVGNLALATAWSYQQNGHFFYLLNVPGLNYTWCLDTSNMQWHKRSTNVAGNQLQLRVGTHCFLNDTHLVGDTSNGNIYKLDLEYYLDGGDNIYFVRQFPHSSNNLNRNFYNLLEIDFQFGVGLVDSSTAPTPVLNDSFNGIRNTELIHHSPDVGGSYVMVNSANPNTALLTGDGYLINPLTPGIPQDAYFRSNTTWPTGNVVVNFTVNVQSNTLGIFDLSRNGSSVNQSDFFFEFDHNGPHDAQIKLGPAGINFNITNLNDHTDYPFQLKYNSTSGVMTCYQGSTFIGSANIGTNFLTGNIGAELYSDQGNQEIKIKNLEVINDLPVFNMPGALPRVALYCSKDGGQTFGAPRYAYLGKIGQWKYRARWGPLGSSRDMVFKVIITEPVKVQMLSAYIDVTSGYA